MFSALDILSIISMIPMDNLADAAQNIIFLNADGGTVARTGRAAKVGAKAGRIVKATRFLRLGRLVMEAIDTTICSDSAGYERGFASRCYH